jgi:hypothetical protein
VTGKIWEKCEASFPWGLGLVRERAAVFPHDSRGLFSRTSYYFETSEMGSFPERRRGGRRRAGPGSALEAAEPAPRPPWARKMKQRADASLFDFAISGMGLFPGAVTLNEIEQNRILLDQCLFGESGAGRRARPSYAK